MYLHMLSRGSNQNPKVEDRMLPVFVFPNSLSFYADDKSQHKQVLTVYNPYDFGIRFKVLCTAPEKYVMADSEGVIRSLCCIDLVIRHNAITNAAIGVTDNFRISVYEHGQKQLLGKKDIPVTLLKTAPREVGNVNAAEQEKFQPIIPNKKSSHLRGGEQYSIASTRQGFICLLNYLGIIIITFFLLVHDSVSSNTLIAVVGLLCIAILAIPFYDGINSQWLPSVNLKLMASFFLGIVVTVFIKS
uniref:MSP domain-containing protein n=1 Tax=Strigamia maritima TaxID=126957 RepID=T1INA0_STRMM